MIVRSLCLPLCCLLLGSTLAGCGGGGDKMQVAPVAGRITLDGVPLAKAEVLFLPIGSKAQQGVVAPSKGVTNEDGRYTLTLELNGATGALVGKHRVEVRFGAGSVPTPVPNELGLMPPAHADQLPARYNVSTELSIEVPAAGTEAADFPLTSAP